MEEKYLMRESKPEDIQMITELKAMLTERDQVIKKLIVRFQVGRCNHVFTMFCQSTVHWLSIK